MESKELVRQFRGATLPKLVEKHIQSQSKYTLQQAIHGMIDHFPIEFRPQVAAYTLDYSMNWFGAHFLTADLGDVFIDTTEDIKAMASKAGMSLNDDQVFDMFNLIVMRVSFLVYSESGLRKQLGIKKGWFS